MDGQLEAPTQGQQIVKAVGARGGNVIEVRRQGFHNSWKVLKWGGIRGWAVSSGLYQHRSVGGNCLYRPHAAICSMNGNLPVWQFTRVEFCLLRCSCACPDVAVPAQM